MRIAQVRGLTRRSLVAAELEEPLDRGLLLVEALRGAPRVLGGALEEVADRMSGGVEAVTDDMNCGARGHLASVRQRAK